MGSPWVPEARIEIGLTGPSVAAPYWLIGDATRGKVGTAAVGPDDIWSDITAYVRNWTYRRGASRGDGIGLRYEAGTASFELNNGDRRFDPTWTAGPYAAGGVSLLTPMVRVRISATWDGVTYRLFTGFADRWIPDYTTPAWSTVTLTATDAFKVFAAIDRNAVTPAVGAGELSGARVSRILDSANWPSDDRRLAAGDATLQATTLAENVITELFLVQDSELGEFYVDVDGNVVFRNRHAVLVDSRSTDPQATFGDGGVDIGEIPYSAAPVDFDDSTMANKISVANTGGTEQTVEDVTSEARYLTKTYQRTDLLLQTDAEALSVAQWLLRANKDPELRFSQLDFNVPRADVQDTAWPALLARELGDRIRVIRRPPGGGSANQQDAFVRGITHNSDGADWKVSFQLQSADKLAFWTIGSPTLGRIGYVGIAF